MTTEGWSSITVYIVPITGRKTRKTQLRDLLTGSFPAKEWNSDVEYERTKLLCFFAMNSRCEFPVGSLLSRRHSKPNKLNI